MLNDTRIQDKDVNNNKEIFKNKQEQEKEEKEEEEEVEIEEEKLELEDRNDNYDDDDDCPIVTRFKIDIQEIDISSL
ncbi:unnamed protein product [Dimorphilus gyrociliatus]|uniref:Uncharacterized protein n=1 Tax=Dimorphilus gyrociliatus TaxID=2664684 RepID=A0A7I8WBB3_9ANNE|nr:unnamed protein product [Dimorphilus gyrociliatus]